MTLVLCDLDLQYIDGKTWRLLADFRVQTDTAGSIEVPAGTITDFNSTPFGLWNLLPPTSYGEAGVAHDHLYKTGMVGGVAITRDIADRVHRELVTFRHAPRWKVWAYYYGLRMGGWKVWNTYRNAD